MDRRQLKTRMSILTAFGELLEKKNINNITVQEIIDRANIGRSTFYAHFETKQDLLRELCEKLFDHIISGAASHTHTHGLCSNAEASESIFCHLLHHLSENENNILELLSSENSEVFLRYFKTCLNNLIRTNYLQQYEIEKSPLPDNFLINHISSSFVEMVLWWISCNRVHTPEELDCYFQAVINPILIKKED